MKEKTAKIWGAIALSAFVAAAGISAVQDIPIEPPNPSPVVEPRPPCIWYAEMQINYTAPEHFVFPTAPMSL